MGCFQMIPPMSMRWSCRPWPVCGESMQTVRSSRLSRGWVSTRHSPLYSAGDARAVVGSSVWLGRSLCKSSDCCLRHLNRHEELVRIQVVFTRLVHDADKFIDSGCCIRDKAIHLSKLKRYGGARLANADHKSGALLYGQAFVKGLTVNSFRPIPCDSYQCTSARRHVPFGSRTSAIPLSFRHRRPPYNLRSRSRTRVERPRAMVSISRISPMIVNHIVPQPRRKNTQAERLRSAARGHKGLSVHVSATFFLYLAGACLAEASM